MTTTRLRSREQREGRRPAPNPGGRRRTRQPYHGVGGPEDHQRRLAFTVSSLREKKRCRNASGQSFSRVRVRAPEQVA